MRAFDREATLRAFNVSREASEKLDVLVAELKRWQPAQNLVSAATLPAVWHRHIADSAQLLDLAPQTGHWLDIGSGGGFPGLVIAILRSEAGLGVTSLMESNGRKCAFLRHVIRLTGISGEVHQDRIERVARQLPFNVSVVSARAVASLETLLAWTNPLLRKGAVGIFPKGQDVEMELDAAARSWIFTADIHKSLTDRDGRILAIRMPREESASHDFRRD
jgi:16S rRNA (guanine527-N7)-methyltransferase